MLGIPLRYTEARAGWTRPQRAALNQQDRDASPVVHWASPSVETSRFQQPMHPDSVVPDPLFCRRRIGNAVLPVPGTVLQPTVWLHSGLRSLCSPHPAEFPVVGLPWQGFSHKWPYLFMKQISTSQGRCCLTQQRGGVIDDIIRN